MTPRRTAPEIIAFHIGADIREVSANRYQSTRYSSPGLYVVGNDYYCSPTNAQRPPSGFDWQLAGEHYGRNVWVATGTQS